MSQKGEKYARRMERRVDKLEQDVAAITTEQTTQGVRISAVEDDLAVYRAAVSARELKQAAAEVKAAKERRTARAAERERKARRRNKVLAFIALALFVAVCVVMVPPRPRWDHSTVRVRYLSVPTPRSRPNGR